MTAGCKSDDLGAATKAGTNHVTTCSRVVVTAAHCCSQRLDVGAWGSGECGRCSADGWFDGTQARKTKDKHPVGWRNREDWPDVRSESRARCCGKQHQGGREVEVRYSKLGLRGYGERDAGLNCAKAGSAGIRISLDGGGATSKRSDEL